MRGRLLSHQHTNTLIKIIRIIRINYELNLHIELLITVRRVCRARVEVNWMKIEKVRLIARRHMGTFCRYVSLLMLLRWRGASVL